MASNHLEIKRFSHQSTNSESNGEISLETGGEARMLSQ